MYLRQYQSECDYEYIERWIDSERTHALWCANSIEYPFNTESFRNYLNKDAVEWDSNAYVVTDKNEIPFGFFVYSRGIDSGTSFLKLVLVDPKRRGQGLGAQMVALALDYAFNKIGVSAVRLNVFDVNKSARKCYAKAGFSDICFTPYAFPYNEELWGRYTMEAHKRTNS